MREYNGISMKNAKYSDREDARQHHVAGLRPAAGRDTSSTRNDTANIASAVREIQPR